MFTSGRSGPQPRACGSTNMNHAMWSIPSSGSIKLKADSGSGLSNCSPCASRGAHARQSCRNEENSKMFKELVATIALIGAFVAPAHANYTYMCRVGHKSYPVTVTTPHEAHGGDL